MLHRNGYLIIFLKSSFFLILELLHLLGIDRNLWLHK